MMNTLNKLVQKWLLLGEYIGGPTTNNNVIIARVKWAYFLPCLARFLLLTPLD